MPKSRANQINIEATPYYHCISRCVRRAHLCGHDNTTGKNYEHRRTWIERRIEKLATVFSIDVCAYAIMHNHTHLVLHINTNQIAQWSDKQVLKNWYSIYTPPLLIKKYIRDEPLTHEQALTVEISAKVFRNRLTDISWFMRSLNEPIARMANSEDNCTGKFWEGRFKSQALLDDPALLACMTYVDLNPIRAKISTTPANSKYTSIKKRIETGENKLAKFRTCSDTYALPFHFNDYLETINLAVTMLASTEKIEGTPLLNLKNLTVENFKQLATSFEKCIKGAVGNTESLTKYCKLTKRRRRFGYKANLRYFS